MKLAKPTKTKASAVNISIRVPKEHKEKYDKLAEEMALHGHEVNVSEYLAAAYEQLIKTMEEDLEEVRLLPKVAKQEKKAENTEDNTEEKSTSKNKK